MSTDFRLPDLGEGLPEAELVQCAQDPLRVVTSHPHPRVEITGRSWEAVRCECVAPDDQEADIMRDERRDELAKVPVELHRPLRTRVV